MLVMAMMPMTIFASEKINYLDSNGASLELTENYEVITSENTPTTWDANWYVVDGVVTIENRVTVQGDVKLILKDNADLIVNGGIDVSGSSNSFTVYAQSIDENKMGSLTATAADETGNAGIGSSDGQTAGAITINGGKITATGGSRSERDIPSIDPFPEDKIYTGAGIGGGEKSGCSTITINGGIVKAEPGRGNDFWETSNSAAIGNGGYYEYDYSDNRQVGNILINGGMVEATGLNSGAGIGGGVNQPIQSIIINGGNINAVSESGAGIGSGWLGDSGTINISGGTIIANSEIGCGIGGGYVGDIQSITITGGDIKAISERGAGIGSCAYRPVAQVTISSGVVTAISNDGGDGIGVGKYKQGEASIDFSTGEHGTAVIFASSIGDENNKNEWSGLIFVGNNGKIYGDNYIMKDGLNIPSDTILTIENGKTLIIPEDVTFNCSGEIRFDEGGHYTGTLPSGILVTYQIQWDTDGDGTVDDITYVASGEMPAHDNGSKEPTLDTIYTFTGWTPALTKVIEPTKYTAQFSSSESTYTVTLPSGEGYIVTTNNVEDVAYDTELTFTVTIKDGYSKTDEFVVKANGEVLNAQDDGSYKITVKCDTNITIDGVLDITAPVISGVTDGAAYYTTQRVTVSDANLKSVTLNGNSVGETFSLVGNTDAVYSIVATDKAGNVTTYNITMKPIASLTERIDDITVANVNSDNKDDIETVKALIAAVDTENASAAEKEALQNIVNKCDALLDAIVAADNAGATENTNKVENITSDNVKPEDKNDLIAAKEDLENALENFKDNYSEQEKIELQNKLDQVNEALDSLGKTENAQNLLTELPNTVEPDDTSTEVLINEAKEQFDKLTDHEKSLIPEELKIKLKSLLDQLIDYQIIDGNNSHWTAGEDGSLTITANGPVEKFVGIEVDGNIVVATNYTIKSGSTIITLKPEYLNTLSIGKHTLTVIYTDGKTSGEFEIVKTPEITVEGTGKSNDVAYWVTIMLIAACSLVGSIASSRKRKYSK